MNIKIISDNQKTLYHWQNICNKLPIVKTETYYGKWQSIWETSLNTEIDNDLMIYTQISRISEHDILTFIENLIQNNVVLCPKIHLLSEIPLGLDQKYYLKNGQFSTQLIGFNLQKSKTLEILKWLNEINQTLEKNQKIAETSLNLIPSIFEQIGIFKMNLNHKIGVSERIEYWALLKIDKIIKKIQSLPPYWE